MESASVPHRESFVGSNAMAGMVGWQGFRQIKRAAASWSTGPECLRVFACFSAGRGLRFGGQRDWRRDAHEEAGRASWADGLPDPSDIQQGRRPLKSYKEGPLRGLLLFYLCCWRVKEWPPGASGSVRRRAGPANDRSSSCASNGSGGPRACRWPHTCSPRRPWRGAACR